MSEDKFLVSSSNKDDQEGNSDLLDLISQLPKAKGWLKPGVTLYQGCWFPHDALRGVIAFQQQFKAQDQDIILASNPKTGTTWLKSLTFSVINRARYPPSSSPLLIKNAHQLVISLEQALFVVPALLPSLSTMNAPRLVSTHMPYSSLTDEIKGPSGARIVYVARNPLDTIASFWNFANRGHPRRHSGEWSMDDCVDAFCAGESWFGPFWSHVLGYWRASLERPEKVLFLKYEDMLEDTLSAVKKIAEFLGFPFSPEEESDGVVEEMIELCSLKKLKELDVNKNEELGSSKMENKIFFRKGEVGDWVNHLSPSMVDRVNKVIAEKLCGSGLTFKYKI